MNGPRKLMTDEAYDRIMADVNRGRVEINSSNVARMRQYEAEIRRQRLTDLLRDFLLLCVGAGAMKAVEWAVTVWQVMHK